MAFTNARIVMSPGHVLDNAVLIVRDSRIEAVGTNVLVPPDAFVRDMKKLETQKEPEEKKG